MLRGSRAEKVAEWQKRLRRFEKTPQTVAEFCRAEGVAQQSYYYWKRKLQAAPANPSTKDGFRPVQVSLSSPSSQPATTIQLGRGIHIELGHDLRVAELVMNRVLKVALDGDERQAHARRQAR